MSDKKDTTRLYTEDSAESIRQAEIQKLRQTIQQQKPQNHQQPKSNT